jgi:hypothetical protein
MYNKIIGLIGPIVMLNIFPVYCQETFPEFAGLLWKNEAAEITGAHLGDEVIISSVVKNIDDGETVKIEIWEDTDNELKDLIRELEATVKDGKIELKWELGIDHYNEKTNYKEYDENTNYYREIETTGFTTLDFVFIIKYGGFTSQKSRPLAIMWRISLLVRYGKGGPPARNTDYWILTPDGNDIYGTTDDNGYVEISNLRIMGDYHILVDE